MTDEAILAIERITAPTASPGLGDFLKAERILFVAAFYQSYSQIHEARTMNLGDQMSLFLNEAFDDEVAIFLETNSVEEKKKFLAYRGIINGNVVAFVSVDANAEEKSVYFRQLAVAPDWQGKGIGRQFVKGVMGLVERDAQMVKNFHAPSDDVNVGGGGTLLLLGGFLLAGCCMWSMVSSFVTQRTEPIVSKTSSSPRSGILSANFIVPALATIAAVWSNHVTKDDSSSSSMLELWKKCEKSMLQSNVLQEVTKEEGGGFNDGQPNHLCFHLCVRRFNEQAIDFYRSLGFVSDDAPSAVAQHGLDPMKYTAMKRVVRDREM